MLFVSLMLFNIHIKCIFGVKNYLSVFVINKLKHFFLMPNTQLSWLVLGIFSIVYKGKKLNKKLKKNAFIECEVKWAKKKTGLKVTKSV